MLGEATHAPFDAFHLKIPTENISSMNAFWMQYENKQANNTKTKKNQTNCILNILRKYMTMYQQTSENAGTQTLAKKKEKKLNMPNN